MTKMLTMQIAPQVTLTSDVITQRVAVIGMSGAGKSNTVALLSENMLALGAQVVILDPDGTWYGLRLAADGNGKGIDIPVFGGLHGDIPLEHTAGALVADLVVDKGISVVLDVSRFRKGQRHRFGAEFAEQLFFRKQEQNSPMYLLIEEADSFLPQKVFKGDEWLPRMQGAFSDICTKGRKYGIGTGIVTQRPQLVDKDSLNQAELVIVHQMYGAQERKAMREWIVNKGQDVNLLDDLPYLAIGEAFLWSPRWLKRMDRVQLNLRKTFDAARTPKFGEKAVAPRTLDVLELESVRAAMQEVIEHAAAHDPKQLRAQVAELKNKVHALEVRPAVPQTAETRIEKILVFREGEVEALRGAHAVEDNLLVNARGVLNQLETVTGQLEKMIVGARGELQTRAALAGALQDALNKAERAAGKQVERITRATPNTMRTAPSSMRAGTMSANGNGAVVKISAGERKVLETLAHNLDGLSKTQLALATGYSHRGGGFNNILSALRTAGRIEGNDPYRLTEVGSDVVGPVERLPSGRELLKYWFSRTGKTRLGRAERLILELLWEIRPDGLSKEELAAHTGYTAHGGGFGNALGKLRTLQLISKETPFRLAAVFYKD